MERSAMPGSTSGADDITEGCHSTSSLTKSIITSSENSDLWMMRSGDAAVSTPLAVSGGSFGLQIGASSTDIIMVFRNRDGLQHLFK